MIRSLKLILKSFSRELEHALKSKWSVIAISESSLNDVIRRGSLGILTLELCIVCGSRSLLKFLNDPRK